MTKALDFDTEGVSPSENLIYKSFLREATESSSIYSAVLRAAKACGVSRNRALDVIRKLNPEFTPSKD